MKYFILLLIIFYEINLLGATTGAFSSSAKCFHPVVDNLKITQSLTIRKGHYSHLDLSTLEKIAWEKFDFLEFDVSLPEKAISELQGAIEDQNSQGYWDKLNFSQKLFPGVNHIKIDLHRVVGERGSVRHRRQINYRLLDKIWFTLDVDNHFDFHKSLSIKNIVLTAREYPKLFPGIKLFSFVDRQEHAFPCFTAVTPASILGKANLGWGFTSKPIEVLNDHSADLLNRYSINLGGTHFRVKLPNGSYQVAMNINRLGYWEPPFWRKRILWVNGTAVRAELRSTPRDFERDFLRFEQVEPFPGDNPWQLYLRPLFTPYIMNIEVKNGWLDIYFDATEKGAILNWLAIWPKKKEQEAKIFLRNLEQLVQKDFTQLSRDVTPPVSHINSTKVVLLPQVSPISPWIPVQGQKNGITLTFVHGYSHLLPFAVMAKEEQKLRVHYSKNKCFDLRLYKGRFQFYSHDINHQTYSIQTKFLYPIENNFMTIIPQKNQQQFFLRLTPLDHCATFRGEWKITFKLGNHNYNFKFPLILKKKKLPSTDLPVGFLGQNGVRYLYFDHGEDIFRQERLKWSQRYLAELAQRGFTTWSGLPVFKGGEALQLLSFTKQHYAQFKTVFTYGGELFDSHSFTANDYIHYQELEKLGFKLIYNFSDEAAGYQDRVKEDIKLAHQWHKKYPTLKLGGFSQMKSSLYELNRTFYEGSYSNFNIREVKKFKRWGLYNLASSPDDNSFFAFGPQLILFQQYGISHLLGWHLSAIQNYPYFDLDGREADAMMLYPTSDHQLLPSIKFEQATLGLQMYRLYLLLNPVQQDKVIHYLKYKMPTVSKRSQRIIGLEKLLFSLLP